MRAGVSASRRQDRRGYPTGSPVARLCVLQPLAMLAGRVEPDPGPALHRHLQVVLVAGEIDRIAVDVGGERRRVLLFEAAPRRFIGISEPARGRNRGRVVDGVDLVLAGQAVGDDLELQLADGAQQQGVAVHALEHLDRALLAELLQAFLQLLRLERIARPRDAEELRGEVRNALEAERFALGQRVTDLQQPVIVMPMMSPATASWLATRSLAMNVITLPSFISRPIR